MAATPMLYVGCGCVVTDGAGRFLLVRETKAIARGRLSLPAGGLEPDETLEQAAIREVAEETGLIVETIGLLGVFHCDRTSENSYGVNFVFGAAVIGGQVAPTVEHPELLWCTEHDIASQANDGKIRGAHVAEAIRRFAAGEFLASDTVSRVGRTI